jgi:hypothetical protein
MPCALARDVVAEPEQECEPEGFTADVDAGTHQAGGALAVAAPEQEPEDDREREQHDHGVEEYRDEAKG